MHCLFFDDSCPTTSIMFVAANVFFAAAHNAASLASGRVYGFFFSLGRRGMALGAMFSARFDDLVCVQANLQFPDLPDVEQSYYSSYDGDSNLCCGCDFGSDFSALGRRFQEAVASFLAPFWSSL